MDGPDIEGLFKCPSSLGERVSYRLAGHLWRLADLLAPVSAFGDASPVCRTNASNASLLSVGLFFTAQSPLIGTQSRSDSTVTPSSSSQSRMLVRLWPVANAPSISRPQSSNLSCFGEGFFLAPRREAVPGLRKPISRFVYRSHLLRVRTVMCDPSARSAIPPLREWQQEFGTGNQQKSRVTP